jgi:hypothetical protein
LCDNCSNDGIEELLPKLNIKNFKYFLGKQKLSSIQVRNFLIKQATGQYIIWL